jgi:hypothetical protein
MPTLPGTCPLQSTMQPGRARAHGCRNVNMLAHETTRSCPRRFRAPRTPTGQVVVRLALRAARCTTCSATQCGQDGVTGRERAARRDAARGAGGACVKMWSNSAAAVSGSSSSAAWELELTQLIGDIADVLCEMPPPVAARRPQRLRRCGCRRSAATETAAAEPQPRKPLPLRSSCRCARSGNCCCRCAARVMSCAGHGALGGGAAVCRPAAAAAVA